MRINFEFQFYLVLKNIFILGLFLPFLASCTAINSYFEEGDAPQKLKEGRTGFRLALTRVLGRPLSQFVRITKAPYGKLSFAADLQEHLYRTLKPLDIVLVRSRPALTRFFIPSHFTHAVIWLGHPDQIIASGILNFPRVRKHRRVLLSGNVVFEAKGSKVQLSDSRALFNTNEIIILRPKLENILNYRKRVNHMFEYLGVEFDTNFDFNDESRLTCIEVIGKVFPQFELPIRYTTGRFALIPDDLARLALKDNPHIEFVEYIKSAPVKRFKKLPASDVHAVLTVPARKKAAN